MSEKFVAAIDQGTTSTRAMVFNREGRVVSVDQREHEQIFPRAGWVEHNPAEIWENTRLVAAGALAKADLDESDIAAVGITNQRETAMVWDRTTGKPVYNAIVWQDTRTDKICRQLGELGGGAERYKAKVGLPLATYFSTEPLASHPRNHCVPVYEVLQVPDPTGDDDEIIIVMPLLRPFYNPRFKSVGEAVEFFRQIFEVTAHNPAQFIVY